MVDMARLSAVVGQVDFRRFRLFAAICISEAMTVLRFGKSVHGDALSVCLANAWDPDDGPKPGQYAQSLNGYELPWRWRCAGAGIWRATQAFSAARRTSRPSGTFPRAITISLPQGAPHHGADSVDMVPGDRSESAEVRPQHLQSERVRFCFRDPEGLLLARSAVASGAAGRSLEP